VAPRTDPRKALADGLALLDAEQKGGLVESMRLLWERVLTAEKMLTIRRAQIVCKHCGEYQFQDVSGPVPDLVTQVRAMEVLMNQQLGKPAESVTVQLQVPQTLRELEGLSMAELAALAGSDEDDIAMDADDAVWEPAEAPSS
jgi:hypothetical protein